jgi:hypothetical protein
MAKLFGMEKFLTICKLWDILGGFIIIQCKSLFKENISVDDFDNKTTMIGIGDLN